MNNMKIVLQKMQRKTHDECFTPMSDCPSPMLKTVPNESLNLSKLIKNRLQQRRNTGDLVFIAKRNNC